LIAILVEGISDAGFVEGICRKLGATCRAFVLGGNNPKKTIRKIRALSTRFNRFIILKDVHGLKSEVLKRFEEEVVRGVGDVNHVRIVFVERSIESWILAGLCEERAKDIDKPEMRLMEKLGRFIIKTFDEYQRLVEIVDLNHAVEKSQSFKVFIEAIKDLLSI